MSEKSSSALTGTPTKFFAEAEAPPASDFGTLASTPPKTPINEPPSSQPPRFMMPGYEILAEIGANDGTPYFSLEYCPRGSLSNCLDGTPLPATLRP